MFVQMKDLVKLYTTAPEAYDGFSTRTLRVVGADDRGRAIREVALEARDRDWQEGRYHSGMYSCFDVDGFAKFASLATVLGWTIAAD